MSDADDIEDRMDRIRLKDMLGQPLAEKELMCLQIEKNGFGCWGAEAPQVMLSEPPHPGAEPSSRIYSLNHCDPDDREETLTHWGAVVVLPGAGGRHMRNDFEDQDEALDWVLGMRAMYAELTA